MDPVLNVWYSEIFPFVNLFFAIVFVVTGVRVCVPTWRGAAELGTQVQVHSITSLNLLILSLSVSPTSPPPTISSSLATILWLLASLIGTGTMIHHWYGRRRAGK
jgi:hypothetical protein